MGRVAGMIMVVCVPVMGRRDVGIDRDTGQQPG
jgi:hypothetical protein